MDFDEFQHGFSKLMIYFKNKLVEDQVDHFFQQLRHIPSAAWHDIATRICDDRRPAQSNFPTVNEIKQGWYVWQQEHPEKILKFQPKPCDDCGSGGLLWYDMIWDGRKYQVMVGCAACQNWRAHFNDVNFLRFRRRADLESQGIEVLPKRYDKLIKPDKSVEELAAGIGTVTSDRQQRIEALKQQAQGLLDIEEPPF